jgi:hypothetical protein
MTSSRRRVVEKQDIVGSEEGNGLGKLVLREPSFVETT